MVRSVLAVLPLYCEAQHRPGPMQAGSVQIGQRHAWQATAPVLTHMSTCTIALAAGLLAVRQSCRSCDSPLDRTSLVPKPLLNRQRCTLAHREPLTNAWSAPEFSGLQTAACLFLRPGIGAHCCCCCLQVVHGDLKPGNVLVDEHFSCVITDFGLSSLQASKGLQFVWCLQDLQASSFTLLFGCLAFIAVVQGQV